MLKKIKSLLKGLVFLCLFASSPILMEHAKDIYFTEVVGSHTVSFTFGKSIYGTGSHIEYMGNYYILTNRHICMAYLQDQSAQNALARTGKAVQVNGYQYPKILKISNRFDLCILEPTKQSGLSLANSYHVNEKVTIMGHPRGLKKTFREGRIFDKQRTLFPWIPELYSDYIHISVIGYGGNSGSAVVNRYGHLVGVIFAGSTVYHTEMMAVTLEDVKYFLNGYIKDQSEEVK